MRLHFLAASDGTRLSKSFRQVSNQLITAPYPLVARFNSFEENASDLDAFYATLTDHADRGHCLLKGQLLQPLFDESRAGLADPTGPHHLLVLDVDGVNGLDPDVLMAALGLDNVSYILQHSASQGLSSSTGFSAHLFVRLAQAHQADALKRWVMLMNFQVPLLRNALSLTRSHMALHWGLDPSVNQNDRLVYIAPPTFQGLDDPLNGERFQLVRHRHDAATLDLSLVPDALKLRARARERVNELRAERALKPLDTERFVTKTIDKEKIEVLQGADQVVITGVKEERAFVYLNLNGGDSWGYFHPAGSPKVLYNFKGEPNYLIEEINPEYYREAEARAKKLRDAARLAERQEEAAQAAAEIDAMMAAIPAATSKVFFYFTEHQTGLYKVAEYDPAAGAVSIAPAPTKQSLVEYTTAHGLPDPVAPMRCTTVYDPTRLDAYRPESKTINLYKPSPYRLAARAGLVTEPPKTIDTLLHHVLGGDDAFLRHFYNWLAYMFQTGTKPGTGWLWSGTTGTGKGLTFERVLRPLFGESNVASRQFQHLEDKFNAEFAAIQLLFCDETEMDVVRNAQVLFNQLNSMVTENVLPIREMRKEFTTLRTYFGIILTANNYNAIRIDYNDRRWNVAPRQERKLNTVIDGTGPRLHAALAAELQDFAHFLMSVEVIEDAVKDPKISEAHSDLRDATSQVADDIVNALKKGDFGYFIDMLPTDNVEHIRDLAKLDPKLHAYLVTLDLMQQSVVQGKPMAFTRDALHALFRYCAGWDNQPAAKFAKAAAKHDLHLTGDRWRVRTVGGVCPGRYFSFTATPDVLAQYRRIYSLDHGLHAVQ